MFPALLTVAFFTLIASYFIVSPDDLKRVGVSGFYSSISVSNVFFWFESDYFDRASEAKPFLHTWSLSVEEQFYLIWPTLLVVFYLIGKSTGVALGLVLISALSFVSAILLHNTHPQAVFYLTPFRVYQFGIGALLAMIPLAQGRAVSGIGSCFAVVSVIVVAHYVDGTSNLFFSSILPALLAGLFIYGSACALTDRIFSGSLIVWLGKRSYSVYLVHWPLIVLWRLKGHHTFSELEKWIMVALSILLGAILHDTVEKRFRFTNATSAAMHKRILIGTMTVLLAVLALGGAFWRADGLPDRVPTELRHIATDIRKDWPKRKKAIRNGECNLQYNKYAVSDYNRELCLANHEQKRSWLILGDSHASGAYLIFKKAYPDIHFNQLTIPGCRLRPSRRITGAKMCDQLYQFVLGELENLAHIEGVVIASNWYKGLTYEIEELVGEIESYGKKVIVVNQRLMFRESVPDIVLTSIGKQQAAARAQFLIDEDKRKLGTEIGNKLANVATTIDSFGLQCPDGCDLFDADGRLLYIDATHLSLAGVRLMARRLEQRYPQLLRR